MANVIFITHPDVVIDPAVPVPQWPLSPKGRSRMEAFARAPVLLNVTAVACSDERKARDGAEILAAERMLPITIDAELGENDRSTTGYIAPPEFWDVVEAFFANPATSVRGWERAVDAQARIVRAVTRVARSASDGDIAIVSHGGVGTLLLASLRGAVEARPYAQPHPGGGCYFVVGRERLVVIDGWRVIDQDAEAAKQ